jgi:hypothetical protein
MKKLIMLAMVLVFFIVTGCVGSHGWTRKDGSPVNQEQFERDREECNRGWAVRMAVDILFTAGILSLIYYFEAKHCMTVKGYEKVKEPQVMCYSGPGAQYYHRPDCPSGLKAISWDRRTYLFKKDAEARGLIPCPVCNP